MHVCVCVSVWVSVERRDGKHCTVCVYFSEEENTSTSEDTSTKSEGERNETENNCPKSG